MTHANAPLSVEERRRLVGRCQTRPISHVAAEMGISRACVSKWVRRYREFGENGLIDRPSVPHRQPNATPADVVARIELLRRSKKWSAGRVSHELACDGVAISVRTVSRHLARLGLNRRRFLDPAGCARVMTLVTPGSCKMRCYWPVATGSRSRSPKTRLATKIALSAFGKPQ